MGSKKNQKRYEDELALFSQARPSTYSLDSDEAYEAFRRHIEEHIQAETRAFHQLRAEAESKLNQPSILTAPPSASSSLSPELPRAPLNKGKTEAAPSVPKAKRREGPSPAQRGEVQGQVPRLKKDRPLATGLLCLSFALIGGLGFQAWQQWQPGRSPKIAHDGKAKGQARPAKNQASAVAVSTPPPLRIKTASNPLAAAVSALPLGTPPPPAPASALIPASTPPQPTQLASAASGAGSSAPALPVACAPAENESASGPREKALITGKGEVRRGPSTQYEILDALPAGTVIEGELTSDRQWLRLEGGRFMDLSQLEILDPKLGGSWVDRWVGAKIANVRALPAMQAGVLKKLNLGEKVRIAPLNKQWAKLEGGGYVYTVLLSESDPQPLRLPALMRVIAEQATIFSAAAAQAAPLGVYFKNHKVQVLEAKDGWYRIGQDQFMRIQDLGELSASTAAASATDREGQRL